MNISRIIMMALTLLGFCVSEAGAQTTVHTGPITHMAVARAGSCDPACPRSITNSREFVDVQNAFVQIRLETESLLIARFASDSFCRAEFRPTAQAPIEPSYCSVRILVSAGPGGQFVEMVPSTSIFEIFQVHEGEGAHAIERSSFELTPGLYTVKVQFSIPFGIEPGAEFSLSHWHLTVEAARL